VHQVQAQEIRSFQRGFPDSARVEFRNRNQPEQANSTKRKTVSCMGLSLNYSSRLPPRFRGFVRSRISSLTHSKHLPRTLSISRTSLPVTGPLPLVQTESSQREEFLDLAEAGCLLVGGFKSLSVHNGFTTSHRLRPEPSRAGASARRRSRTTATPPRRRARNR